VFYIIKEKNLIRKIKDETVSLCLNELEEILSPFDPQKLIEARTRTGEETEQWMIDDAREKYLLWQKGHRTEILRTLERLQKNLKGSTLSQETQMRHNKILSQIKFLLL
jgi:hypothetical protein